MTPILKGVYICDDVVRGSDSGKPVLVNLWDTWWVSTRETFPIRINKLCVFAWLRGGRGSYPFRVDLVICQTGQLIGRTPVHSLDLSVPNRSIYARFMITNFPIPEPGGYLVELFCGTMFLDDQMISVRVRPEESRAQS